MKNKKENKQNIKKIRYLSFVCVAVCLTLNVILSVNLNHIGLKMSKLEKEIAEIKQTEKKLRYELISNTSLMKMEEYAKTHGFVKPTEIVYIKHELNGLAKLP